MEIYQQPGEQSPDPNSHIEPFIFDGKLDITAMLAAAEMDVDTSANPNPAFKQQIVPMGSRHRYNPTSVVNYDRLTTEEQYYFRQALASETVSKQLHDALRQPTQSTYTAFLHSVLESQIIYARHDPGDKSWHQAQRENLVLPSAEKMTEAFKSFTGTEEEVTAFATATARVLSLHPHRIQKPRPYNAGWTDLPIRRNLTLHSRRTLGFTSADEFSAALQGLRTNLTIDSPEKVKAFTFLQEIGYAGVSKVSADQLFKNRMRGIGTFQFETPVLKMMIETILEDDSSQFVPNRNAAFTAEDALHQVEELFNQISFASPVAGQLQDWMHQHYRTNRQMVPAFIDMANQLGQQLMKRGVLPEGISLEKLKTGRLSDLPQAIDRFGYVGILDAKGLTEEERDKYELSFRLLSAVVERAVTQNREMQGLTIGAFILAHPELSDEEIADAMNEPNPRRQRQPWYPHRPNAHAHYRRHEAGYGIIS